jgi:hypothetical protein
MPIKELLHRSKGMHWQSSMAANIWNAMEDTILMYVVSFS